MPTMLRAAHVAQTLTSFFVADDRLLARRARGRVDARELLARHGEQAERVSVAQVRLRRERQLRDVFDAVDVAGQQPHLVKALFVKRHVFIAAVHDLHKALRLDLPQRLAVGAFDFRIVILHGEQLLPCFTRGSRVQRHACSCRGISPARSFRSPKASFPPGCRARTPSRRSARRSRPSASRPPRRGAARPPP